MTQDTFAKAAGKLIRNVERARGTLKTRHIISIYLTRVIHVIRSVINILDSTRLIYCAASNTRFISQDNDDSLMIDSLTRPHIKRFRLASDIQVTGSRLVMSSYLLVYHALRDSSLICDYPLDIYLWSLRRLMHPLLQNTFEFPFIFAYLRRSRSAEICENS